jgi:hypothetical protein
LQLLDLPLLPCSFLKFHEFGFNFFCRLYFCNNSRSVSFYKSGLELLLALNPPPPVFGVILLGFGAPGTPGGLGTGLGAILLLYFISITAPRAPGLFGVIFGSSFFFWVLNCDKSMVCPVILST